MATPKEQVRLRQLEVNLSMSQRELAAASGEDPPDQDKLNRCHRDVRLGIARIQEHCEKTGLPLPPHVPEKK